MYLGTATSDGVFCLCKVSRGCETLYPEIHHFFFFFLVSMSCELPAEAARNFGVSFFFFFFFFPFGGETSKKTLEFVSGRAKSNLAKSEEKSRVASLGFGSGSFQASI